MLKGNAEWKRVEMNITWYAKSAEINGDALQVDGEEFMLKHNDDFLLHSADSSFYSGRIISKLKNSYRSALCLF